MQSKKKVAAVITDVFFGLEDHGIMSFSIALEFVSGASQSFGSINLSAPGSSQDLYNTICSIFCVRDIDKIIGLRCYALYCFGEYNERIEGIETEGGNRFTLTSFMKKYDPTIQNPLERAKQHQFDEIERSVQKILTASKKVESLVTNYTSWD